MSSFKVPCPSCEARVLIKNPDLIGTKVECPKCKYRFKVEAPADAAAPSDAKPAAEKKPATATDEAGAKKKKDKKEKAAKEGGKKNNKVLLGAVLGVVAVGLLGVGGYIMFGGEEKKPSPSPGGFRPPPPVAQGPGGESPIGTENPGETPDPGAKPKPAPVVKAVPLVRSDKNPANLLPGEAVAVYKLDLDRLRQTPLGGPLFDSAVSTLFRDSLGFEPSLVERYYHCSVGEKERASFGLIRLREPVAEAGVRFAGAGAAKPVNGKTLYPVRANPFLTAAGNAFAARSLLADVYEPAAGKDAARTAEPQFGACVYDSQTVLVGDLGLLEKYLGSLKDGYPEFQTVYRKENLSVPMPPPKETDPTAPATPEAPPAPPEPPKDATQPADPKPAPPPPPPVNKDFTSNPHYLSVNPELKKMLNLLEEQAGAVVVVAEKFDDAAYDRKSVKAAYKPIAKVLDPVLSRTQYVGLNVTAFTPRQFTATLRLVGKSGDDARHIALNELTPGLTEGIPLTSMLLFTNPYPNPYGIEFRSYAVPNPAAPTEPEIVIPYYAPPPLVGGRPGDPTMPVNPFQPGGQFPSGSPFQPGSTPGSPYSFQPGGTPGSPFTPPPRFRRGETPDGPGEFPGRPGDPTRPGTDPTRPPVPHVDLRLSDQFVTLSVDLLWDDEVYGRAVAPRLFGFVNQLKGKAAVYAGNATRTGLAAAVGQYVEKNKRFPAGTVPRPPTDADRLGLPYPPVQRLSLFAELLPYIPGRQPISNGLNRGAAWYDESKTSRNADAAGAWVPELLVSYYPPSAWRATSPLAPEHTFGGTNFVAVAGVGADAARFDPKDKAREKLVGISGYDWGSAVEEVTDGPANTIFLLQVPPGLSRPWASGGGATVMGVNPDRPMDAFAWDHPDGNGGTKRGTYAIMGDGAVRWLPADIDPKVFLALATRAGGEKIADLDKVAPRVDRSAELKTDPKAAAPVAPKTETPAGKAETAPAPKAK